MGYPSVSNDSGWWCSADVLVVQGWSTGGVLVVFWWSTGSVLSLFWWSTGGVAGVPGGAVQVAAVDEVVFGVRPVEFLLAVVQRQPIGPVDLSVNDHGAVGPIHPGPLDLWDLAPVRPVHEPVTHRQGAETAACLKHVGEFGLEYSTPPQASAAANGGAARKAARPLGVSLQRCSDSSCFVFAT